VVGGFAHASSSSTAQQTVPSQGNATKKRPLSDVPYAQYGLGKGSILHCSEMFSCIVISTGWPSWVLAALSRGVRVVLVICKDLSWKNVIKYISPCSEIVLWSDIVPVLARLPTVNFSFSDEDFAQGKLKSLWIYVQHYVVVSRAAQQSPANWFCTPINISHFDCGDVTDTSWLLSVYAHTHNLQLCIPQQGGRDLSSCSNALVRSGVPCLAPPPVQTNSPSDQPTVIEIHPSVLDCQGLLPRQSWNSLFVTRCTFSPTKWCKQKVTLSKLSKALDIPEKLWEAIPSTLQSNILSDVNLFPSICSIAIFDGMLALCLPRKNNSQDTQVHCHTAIDGSGAIQTSIGPAVKATKSDDARVPSELWNDRVLSEQP
jgi:hypothetical protein